MARLLQHSRRGLLKLPSIPLIYLPQEPRAYELKWQQRCVGGHAETALRGTGAAAETRGGAASTGGEVTGV